MTGKISLTERYYLEMDDAPYSFKCKVWAIKVEEAHVFRSQHPDAKEISKDVYYNLVDILKQQ